jgi:hypothetical protein
MAVQLFYVDESFDEQKFCLTALWIRHRDWHRCFHEIRAHRLELRNDYGLRVRKEIHARELVSGRGDLGTDEPLTKWQRSRIFLGVLRLLSRLLVRLLNVCLDIDEHGDAIHLRAWDRLVNRIERSMRAIDDEESTLRQRLAASALPLMAREDGELLKHRLDAFACRALIISDAGHEKDITRALRRMHVYNPIPSKFGEWAPGQRVKSIPTNRIIEDPIFRSSRSSPILQVVDCAAYALLKRETMPTTLVKRYGIHKMFDAALAPLCVRKASAADPLGVVRG